MKTALKGTSIEEKDAKEIISGVQAMYDKIPGFIRPMLPSLPDILKRIPSSAPGTYLIEAAENSRAEAFDAPKALRNGRINRRVSPVERPGFRMSYPR